MPPHHIRHPTSDIRHPLSCSRCGYDLAGLPAHGLCPECGQPVALSRQGLLFSTRSAEYVARVKLGLIILQVACAASLVGTFALVALSSAWPFSVGSGFLRLAVLATLLWGWSILTAKDPGLPDLYDAPASRKTVRRLAPIVLAMELTQFLAAAAAPAGNPFTALAGPGTASDLIRAAWVFVKILLWLFVLVASFDNLRWLCARLPWPRGISILHALLPVTALLMVAGRLFCATDALALIPYWVASTLLCARVGAVLTTLRRAATAATPAITEGTSH